MTEHRRPESSVRPGFAREDWNARYAQQELVWSAEPNRLFAAEVAALSPGRALDLACGEGRNAVWLAEQGWRVTGVDFSDVALAKAAELAASRGVEAEWVVADVLDYEPERHGSRSRRGPLSAAGAGRDPPRGADSGRRGRAGRCARRPRPRHHEPHARLRGPKDASVLYTPEDIVPALGDLVVERAEAVERTVALPDGEAVAIDAFVRAHRPV